MTVFNCIINNKYILHQSNPDEALGSQDTLDLTEEEQKLLSLKPRNLCKQDKRKRKALQQRLKNKRHADTTNAQRRKYRRVNNDAVNAQQRKYRQVNKDAVNVQQRENRGVNNGAVNDQRREYRRVNNDAVND